MTAFEPEALGNLVEGLDFHRFYFENREQSLLSGVPVVCSCSMSCRMAQQGDGQGTQGGSAASEEEDPVWTGVGTVLAPSPNPGISDCQLSLLWLRMGTWKKCEKPSQSSPASALTTFALQSQENHSFLTPLLASLLYTGGIAGLVAQMTHQYLKLH